MLEDGRTDQSSAYGTLLDGEPGDPCTCPRWDLSVFGMSLTQGYLCEYDLREGSFFVVPHFSLTHSVLEEMECMTWYPDELVVVTWVQTRVLVLGRWLLQVSSQASWDIHSYPLYGTSSLCSSSSVGSQRRCCLLEASWTSSLRKILLSDCSHNHSCFLIPLVRKSFHEDNPWSLVGFVSSEVLFF